MNTSSTMSPTIPSHSGTATVNRTLLHHQQNNTLGSVGGPQKNGPTAAIRGFAINSSSESPPPDYNMVHDTKRHAIHFIYHLFFVKFRLSTFLLISAIQKIVLHDLHSIKFSIFKISKGQSNPFQIYTLIV